MFHAVDSKQNALLDAMESAGCLPLLASLEEVELTLGQVLCHSGSVCRYVYFPSTAIVSLACLTEDGACAEVASVGNEGLVGVSVFMGGLSTNCSAEVQRAGSCHRISAHELQLAFEQGGPLVQILLRYTQTLMTQITQAAVCNRHHALGQQLCRWLLHMLDRVHDNDMVATHQVIARALGVRREGVTEAALKLQHAGVISYKRGHITVLDRHVLEQQACECYALVSKECGRLREGRRYPAGHTADGLFPSHPRIGVDRADPPTSKLAGQPAAPRLGARRLSAGWLMAERSSGLR